MKNKCKFCYIPDNINWLADGFDSCNNSNNIIQTCSYMYDYQDSCPYFEPIEKSEDDKIKKMEDKKQIEKIYKVFKKYNFLDIIWLENNKFECFNFETKIYTHLNDIKRNYHGQSYIYYPITYFEESNKIILTKIIDNKLTSNIDGYIMVSKRMYRTVFNKLKYVKSEILKNEVNKSVNNFIEEINNINVLN